ncbi:MAG: transporter [Planctomycetota bacterium]
MAVRLLPILAAAALAGAADAQTIDTNRPGFSFTPGIVPVGLWQLETGLSFTRFDARTRAATLPLAELRMGVAERVEFFAASMTWSRIEEPGSDTSGFEDFAVGTKIGLSPGDASARLALLLEVGVPAGASGLTTDRWDPTAGLVWAWDAALPLAGTSILTDLEDGVLFANGLKVPFSWRDRHSGFAEWEANVPEGGGSANWLNGGYQWLLGERMQFDASVGLGIGGLAGDYRFGVGFSIRP